MTDLRPLLDAEWSFLCEQFAPAPNEAAEVAASYGVERVLATHEDVARYHIGIVASVRRPTPGMIAGALLARLFLAELHDGREPA